MDFAVEQDRLIVIHEGREIDIPADAIASWSELLGYDNSVDALDAIIHVAIHGEPDSDPVTMENAWTAPFLMLAEREEAREQEYLTAQKEGRAADPRSPELRSMLAAQTAVRAEDGTCVMSAAQKATRDILDVPDPVAAPPLRRGGRVLADKGSRCKPDSGKTEMCAEDREKAAEILSDNLEELAYRRKRFCHATTSFKDNPLWDVVNEEIHQDALELNVEDVKRRHRRDAAGN